MRSPIRAGNGGRGGAKGLPVQNHVPRIPLSRGSRGSVLPVVVFSLMMTIAFLAFTMDVMRTAHAISVLDFSSQATALAAYSFAVNSDGSYTPNSARANMLNAVQQVSGSQGSAWNMAPAGPEGVKTRTDIVFADGDIAFVNNPNPQDGQEIFLQVKARRDGNDALKLFFFPAIFAFNSWSGSPAPNNVNVASPNRTSEVVGQPASRLGAAAPKSGAGGPRAAQLAGFAAFPLALSNTQFGVAAQPAQTTTQYIIDLVASNQAGYAAPAAAGHIKGCLVNVAPTGSNLTYYGQGQGNLAIDQLNSTLQYFNPGFNAQALNPGIVERGSQLNAFDPADQAFQQRKNQVVGYLTGLIGQNCMLPVVVKNGDQFFNGPNVVVGFARMRLRQVNNSASGINAVFDMLESVPMPNASFANGIASVPSVTGTMLPPPVAPFVARIPENDGLSARPRGVVLAPALSPRNVNPFVVN